MVDRVTQLIELALSSTTDSEKLAALSQAKKIYKNTGVTLPKRVVRETATAPQAADALESRTFQEALKKSENLRAKLVKDNQTLSAENTELRSKLLDEGNKADATLLDDTARKMRKVVRFAVAGWTVAVACAVVIVTVML